MAPTLRGASALIVLGILFLVTACAGSNLRTNVTITARAVHDAIEIGAPAWVEFVDDKVVECEEKKLPNRSAGEKCLGAAVHAPKAAALMESIKAGQLALFVALAEDRSDPEVLGALAALRSDFLKLLRLWVDAGVCKDQCARVAKLLLPAAGG